MTVKRKRVRYYCNSPRRDSETSKPYHSDMPSNRSLDDGTMRATKGGAAKDPQGRRRRRALVEGCKNMVIINAVCSRQELASKCAPALR